MLPSFALLSADLIALSMRCPGHGPVAQSRAYDGLRITRVSLNRWRERLAARHDGCGESVVQRLPLFPCCYQWMVCNSHARVRGLGKEVSDVCVGTLRSLHFGMVTAQHCAALHHTRFSGPWDAWMSNTIIAHSRAFFYLVTVFWGDVCQSNASCPIL